MRSTLFNFVLLLAGLLLIPFHRGFGECIACQELGEAVEVYEELEVEIEEWVCIGYEALVDENGDIVEQAIMEIRYVTATIMQISYYIESFSGEHTCNLPVEELPE